MHDLSLTAASRGELSLTRKEGHVEPFVRRGNDRERNLLSAPRNGGVRGDERDATF